MPVIDECSFGNIVVDGKKYNSDLMIYPDGHVEDGWRRKRGHRLVADDIDRLVSSGPEIIIVGMGTFGLMKPVKDLKSFLNKKGISMVAQPNKKAIHTFNTMSTERQTGACFHLTC